MEQYTTDVHGYQQMWLHQKDSPFQAFRVKTCSDAHIALAANIQDTSQAYEVNTHTENLL